MTKFYEFHQNNSGGSFVFNEDLSYKVIIEARSADEANRKAEEIGIYFNGCDDGTDCSCCGDRWYPADGYGASDTADTFIDPKWTWWTDKDGTYMVIHYLDGRKERIKKKGEEHEDADV